MIPSFTSIATVESGLIKSKELLEERCGWNDPAQLYPDSHYRAWLVSRIQDWDQLTYVKGHIAANPGLSFVQCKMLVLNAVKAIRVEMNKKLMREKELKVLTSTRCADSSGPQ